MAADPLTAEQAVAKAEEFVLANGYTDAESDKIKQELEHESLERASSRDEILKARFNTLQRRAIGVRRGAQQGAGWSVAFDYVEPHKSEDRAACRVVTMKPDGSDMRVEHQDGIRDFFEGFSDK